MERTYWLKQSVQQPLFEDLMWSRPEHKVRAGKLCLVGGNAHSFSAVAEAFQAATVAGIGAVNVILPDVLYKTLGNTFTSGQFAPSTPSGSFARTALAPLLEVASWADGTLLAGDFGRNSETAVMLETFLSKYEGKVIITRDALDYFTKNPPTLIERDCSTIVASLAQLRDLTTSLQITEPIGFNMDLLHLVDRLHELTDKYPANIVVKHHEHLCIAVDGEVVTTKLDIDEKIWRVTRAAQAAVWWIQNPNKPVEALASAMLEPGA